MLELHSSNRLENLADRLGRLIGVPSTDPWEREVVMIYSAGMTRWLSMRLAERWGICAHLEFPFAAGFLTELLAAALPEGDRLRAAGYRPERLQWTIFEALEEAAEWPGGDVVSRYLRAGGAGDRRKFALAASLARLFDEYQVYRPRWIAQWDRGKTRPGEWQSRLWRAIVERSGPFHRVALQERFRKLDDTALREMLPARMSLFGISSLAPFFIEMLGWLGKHTDVHVFCLNPCRHYWSDVHSKRAQARRRARGGAGQLELPLGGEIDFSDLLTVCGRAGADFFDGLLESGPQTSEEFVSGGKETLLGAVQLELLDPGQHRFEIREDLVRPSIQIHSCHSRLREIEVVRDIVLDLLENDSQTEPRDIVVMAPDMAQYAGVVGAVFGPAAEHPLPFSVGDLGWGAANPAWAAWLQLIEGGTGRMTATEVLNLLDCAAVRTRFGISEGQLETIHRWVKSSGIRWGWDGRFKERQFGVPPVREHTWEWGCDRMLLGGALPLEESALFGGVLPFDDIDEQDATLLSALLDFLESVGEIRLALTRDRNVAEWVRFGHRVLDRCFADPREGGGDLLDIRRFLVTLEEETGEQAGGPRTRISVDGFVAWARDRMFRNRQSGGFLSHGICFCSLTPMRSVPARTVILVGMNRMEFPRRDSGTDLDLRRRDRPRPGDRSRVAEDRQIFLEAVLAARQRLVITYQGRNQRDNQPLAPSGLVSLLLNEVERITGRGPETILCEHPLHPFSPQAFRVGMPAFSRGCFLGASSLCRTPRMPDSPVVSAADSDREEIIPAAEFRRFLLRPAEGFLRHHFGAGVVWEPEGLKDREPLEVDDLALWQAADSMLRLMRGNMRWRDAREIVMARGELPAGQHGAAALEGIRPELEALFAREEALAGQARDLETDEGENFRIELAGTVLEGRTRGCGEQSRVMSRHGRTRGRDVTALWLEHLLGCAAGGTGTSYLLSSRDGEMAFAPLAAEEARRLLSDLTALMVDGFRRPLALDPDVSYVLASSGRDRAWAAARNALDRALAPRSVRWLYLPDILADGKRFRSVAESVYRPCLRHSTRN